VRRYALRDDQWDRIKDILLGRRPSSCALTSIASAPKKRRRTSHRPIARRIDHQVRHRTLSTPLNETPCYTETH